MLHEVLRGEKELFDGLWIGNSGYQFKEHGVITLDLSSLGIKDAESFKNGVCYALDEIANAYELDISLDKESPELALRGLVKALRQKYNAVALLVDEYDYPILQALKEPEKAQSIRDAIRRFFATIKGLDEAIDLAFITGVSSFAKAGLFSGLNNLRIITLKEQFASICGYSDEEIDKYFEKDMHAWSAKEKIGYQELRQKIREWYNGYHFGGNVVAVYNPFSFMNAVDGKIFKNFWFQTGTPTFLVDELTKEYRKSEFDPEKLEISEDTLGIFDVGATPLPALMFQTGYLTITSYNPVTQLYKLGYPNFEVKTSLQKILFESLAYLEASSLDRIALQLRNALNQKNITLLVDLIKQAFVKVPYQEHIKLEAFYHALLQMFFDSSGIKTRSETTISHGRIDLELEMGKLIYIIEVKFNASAAAALEQIKARKYHEAFLSSGKEIVLLGLNFERKPSEFAITSAHEIIPARKSAI
jgi:hypothetical protein